MTGKDARKKSTRTSTWKLPLSLIFAAVAILAGCALVRSFWGSDSASAKNPFRKASANKPVSAKSPGFRPTTLANGPAQKSKEMKVMAVVNSQQISRQQLAQECLRRYGTEVLESLVNKHLILSACSNQGIIITEQDVSEEIAHIAKKFGLSLDRYLSLLKDERNIDSRQYANDIVWPTIALRRIAANQIKVTEQEVQKILDSELGPKVKVRIISVRKREKAQQLLAQAQADPEAFGKLAKDHSEDRASASAYGLIPPIRRHVGDPTVEQVAYSLQEGEVSGIVEVANQFLIIKCEKRIGRSAIAPNQEKEATRRIVEHLRDQKLREAGTALFKRLQDEAQVKNVYNNPQLSRQMPGVAALINGRQLTIRELSEECLVRHGLDVLEGEINRLLLTQQLGKRKLAVSQQDIDAEIARAADANVFTKPDGSPDVQAWLKEVTKVDGATIDLYVSDAVWPTVALKKIVAGKVKVTQEDLHKGFEANYGPRVQALAIVLGSLRQAQQVWEMARNDPTDLFFGKLAEQYSIEPTSKANSGRIPPIQRYGGQDTIEEVAFGLKPGEMSGILSVGDKNIILRCLGRTKPVVSDFNTVRALLYKDLLEKKMRIAMAKEFDRIHESSQIDNFLAGTTQAGKAAQLPGQNSKASNRIPFARSASRPSGTAPVRRK